MIELAIRRPVGTLLILVGIVLAGVGSLWRLQVSPLPQVDFPVIQVQALLPGASPETLAATVAGPLERRLGIIAGVTEMHSTSSIGVTEINIEFDLNRDINSAARDVQAAIAAARSDLPASLVSSPTYSKANPTDAPILIIALTSTSLSQPHLYDVATSVLLPQLSQLAGVGLVELRGSSLPGIRVRVNSRALGALNVGMEQVRAALAATNVNLPKGAIDSGNSELQLYANDQARTAQEFGDVPVAVRNGWELRLRDIAEVSDSVEDVHAYGIANGEPAVVLLVYKQAGANIVATTDRVKAALPGLRAALGSDVRVTFGGDRSATIRAALADTEQTLILGVVLVVAVVFVFLHSWKAVLIPAVTVMGSLFGTLAGMYLLGYSLNNLTLMALTIATGFVIDDAIVVLENVTRHVESGSPRFHAALYGAREVAFTVVSMSASLVAVFLPLLLLGGIAGRLIHEFAVTLALSITISLVLSLTLTPMMCAWYLDFKASTSEGRFARAGRRFIDRIQAGYGRSLHFALARPIRVLMTLLIAVVLNVVLLIWVPKGFFPEQDSGLILGRIRTDPGGSFSTLQQKMQAVEGIFHHDAAVDTVVVFAGGQDFTSANVFVRLKPLGRRDPAGVFMRRVRPAIARIAGIRFSMFSIQDLFAQNGQYQGQYQFSLLGDDASQLYAATDQLVSRLATDQRLRDVTLEQQIATSGTVFSERSTLARIGLTSADVDAALYDALGQRQVSTMYGDREQYHVVMEAALQRTRDGIDLSDLLVNAPRAPDSSPNNSVPLSAVGQLRLNRRPMQVFHLGQAAAMPVSFNVAPGYAVTDAMGAIERAMGSLRLPASIHMTFTGSAAKSQSNSGDQSALWLLAAALGTVFGVLGMLYESYAHPLTILSTLPSAGIGAILALQLAGMPLTVVALIGVILVTGIVMKNAIMMVDFALHAEREQGLSSCDSIHAACLIRFRPIMMTTAAAFFAALPMILQSGAGSELRRPLGVSIAGGLIVSQLLTLYTTPAVYLLLDRLGLRIGALRTALRWPAFSATDP